MKPVPDKIDLIGNTVENDTICSTSRQTVLEIKVNVNENGNLTCNFAISMQTQILSLLSTFFFFYYLTYCIISMTTSIASVPHYNLVIIN